MVAEVQIAAIVVGVALLIGGVALHRHLTRRVWEPVLEESVEETEEP